MESGTTAASVIIQTFNRSNIVGYGSCRYGRDSLFVHGRPAAERGRPGPLLTRLFDPPTLIGDRVSMSAMSVNRALGFAV